ncbi:MAG: hypothetical protein ACFFG0_00665 [Candidatus Thorarchaeota archaeon]
MKKSYPEKSITKNPCELCLVRTTCIEICPNLKNFGTYLREKNNGVPLGSYIWHTEHEKRSRVLEEFITSWLYKMNKNLELKLVKGEINDL